MTILNSIGREASGAPKERPPRGNQQSVVIRSSIHDSLLSAPLVVSAMVSRAASALDAGNVCVGRVSGQCCRSGERPPGVGGNVSALPSRL
jgi:hypothetical protein